MVWFSSNWDYRKELTSNSTLLSGSVTGLPAYVSLTDASLAAKAQSSGDDIVFTKGDGSTQLDHEIEEYDGGTGELNAHVKSDLPGDSNSVIYMYYGNSGASDQQNTASVWSSGYAGVWHMNEDPNGTAPQFTDSSPNSNDMTVQQGVSSITGKVGQAVSTTAAGHATMSDDPTLDFTSSLTVEHWIRPVQATAKEDPFNADEDQPGTYLTRRNQGAAVSSPSETFTFQLRRASDNSAFVVESGNGETPTNSWTHATGIYDGSQVRSRINGTEITTGAFPCTIGNIDIRNVTSQVYLGQHPADVNQYDGRIDEVRVSSTVRGSDYTTATFNSQDQPGNFFTVGSEEQETTTVTDTAQKSSFGWSSTQSGETGKVTDTAQKSSFAFSYSYGYDTVDSGGTNDVQIDTYATIPTGASLDVVVEEVVDADGSRNSVRQSVADGDNSYTLSGFDNTAGNDYYIRAELYRGSGGTPTLDTVYVFPQQVGEVTDTAQKASVGFTSDTADVDASLTDTAQKASLGFTSNTGSTSQSATDTVQKASLAFSPTQSSEFATVGDVAVSSPIGFVSKTGDVVTITDGATKTAISFEPAQSTEFASSTDTAGRVPIGFTATQSNIAGAISATAEKSSFGFDSPFSSDTVDSGGTSDLQIDTYASVPTGASLDVVVEEVVDADGSRNSVRQSVDDGVNSYTLSGFDNTAGNDYFIRGELYRGSGGSPTLDTVYVFPGGVSKVTDTATKSSFGFTPTQADTTGSVTDSAQKSSFGFNSPFGSDTVDSGGTNDVEIDTYATVPTGASLDVIVEEVVDADGSRNSVRQSVDDGVNTYTLSGFDVTPANDYYIRGEFYRGSGGSPTLDTVYVFPQEGGVITDAASKAQAAWTPTQSTEIITTEDTAQKSQFAFTAVQTTESPSATDTAQKSSISFTATQTTVAATDQSQKSTFGFTATQATESATLTESAQKSSFAFNPTQATASSDITDTAEKASISFGPSQSTEDTTGSVGSVKAATAFSPSQADDAATTVDASSPAAVGFTANQGSATAIAPASAIKASHAWTPDAGQAVATAEDTAATATVSYAPAQSSEVGTATDTVTPTPFGYTFSAGSTTGDATEQAIKAELAWTANNGTVGSTALDTAEKAGVSWGPSQALGDATAIDTAVAAAISFPSTVGESSLEATDIAGRAAVGFASKTGSASSNLDTAVASSFGFSANLGQVEATAFSQAVTAELSFAPETSQEVATVTEIVQTALIQYSAVQAAGTSIGNSQAIKAAVAFSPSGASGGIIDTDTATPVSVAFTPAISGVGAPVRLSTAGENRVDVRNPRNTVEVRNQQNT